MSPLLDKYDIKIFLLNGKTNLVSVNLSEVFIRPSTIILILQRENLSMSLIFHMCNDSQILEQSN